MPDPVFAAGTVLSRARWAARVFARYDRATVDRIAHAVADTAAANAGELAERVVQETGSGVVEDQAAKQLACSRGLLAAHRGLDCVTPRVEPDARAVAVPRPAGVVLGLVPATDTVSTLQHVALLTLLTRNALVLAPHPGAATAAVAAARALAAAATAAGAPDGAIQVVERPSADLVEALRADERTDLVVTGGGTGIGAGRSDPYGGGAAVVPVLVDASADPATTARRIAHSTSVDNSLGCTGEAALIVVDPVADRVLGELRGAGGQPLDPEQTDRLRAALYPDGRFDPRFVGRDARWIAAQVGIPAGPDTRVLLAPLAAVGAEEPLARGALCPVLGWVRAETAGSGVRLAAALLRGGGGPGSVAAVHSSDEATVLDCATTLPVRRVLVNTGSSPSGPEFATHLFPSTAAVTGRRDRDAADLTPERLLSWTRVDSDARTPFVDVRGLDPGAAPAPGPVPAYPHASNLLASHPAE